MKFNPEHITIAVTVFNRREYVLEAIHSALNQITPVKVIVVEDCGPDPTLRDFILKEFAGRVEYFRNSKNRGLFDNWNACMQYCKTPWLSILHDDDLLRPNFVKSMLALSEQAPGRGLYFGRHAEIKKISGEWKEFYPLPQPVWDWRDIDLPELAERSILGFVGNLFNVAEAEAIGSFRKKSYYTGDWDMWLRLASRFGAVETSVDIGIGRSHEGMERGTTLINRRGWKWLLDNVQRKRNLAYLHREKGIFIPYERTKLLEQHPISLRSLLRFCQNASARVSFYNWWLFTHSKPPNWRYAIFQWLARISGLKFIRIVSILKKQKAQ